MQREVRERVIFKKLLWLMAIAVLACPAISWAAGQPERSKVDLAEMSIEELMNIEVTSVSKKAEPVFYAPSAVFVITQEDIRRSGATNIPDVLSMAPGVHVARIDANKWAVSIRGFNGSFANKLLVLIDGRSVYTPLFSGVYWDVQDLALEDIERIEIIRGPGATLWGANAVNGVVNIITKKAGDTQGALGSFSMGDFDRGTATVRYGGQLSEKASIRVWGKRLECANFEDSQGRSAGDHWNLQHGGFRLDMQSSPKSEFTVQADAYNGVTGQTRAYPSLSLPFSSVLKQRGTMDGGNILGRWSGALSSRASTAIQFYADYAGRDDGWLDTRLTTLDLDCQQNWQISSRADLVAGAGVRQVRHHIDSTAYTYAVPAEGTYTVFSTFVQTKLAIIKNHLDVTAGSKLEHNSYTGFEYQPSVRALWSPGSSFAIWSAVSRAVRTPSIGERMADIWTGVVPPFTAANQSDMLMRIDLVPTPDFASEILIAKEVGVRYSPRDNIWVDASFFSNQYDDVILATTGDVQVMASNPPMLQLPVITRNSGSLEVMGGELTVDWSLTRSLRTQVTYTYLDRRDDGAQGAGISADPYMFSSPDNVFGIRVQTSPARWCDVDLCARHVGELVFIGVDAYESLDARLAVRPTKGLEVAVVGKNLLDAETTQFLPEINTYETTIPRSFHCAVTWGI